MKVTLNFSNTSLKLSKLITFLPFRSYFLKLESTSYGRFLYLIPTYFYISLISISSYCSTSFSDSDSTFFFNYRTGTFGSGFLLAGFGSDTYFVFGFALDSETYLDFYAALAFEISSAFFYASFFLLKSNFFYASFFLLSSNFFSVSNFFAVSGFLEISSFFGFYSFFFGSGFLALSYFTGLFGLGSTFLFPVVLFARTFLPAFFLSSISLAESMSLGSSSNSTSYPKTLHH